MPTYTYRCKNCNKTQDEFHAMSAKPRIKCNACGAACKRMIGTGAGLIFKGSGFYETDYKSRTGHPTESAKSESGSESKSETKSETKTEKSSKPESKPKKSAEKTAGTASSKD